MASPSVSVVMSVFNGEAYLAQAVESILNQTFRDFEFIIIDDGSTDRTPEILAGYARRDRRVRVFPQKNIGRAESLNRGIALSSSPLIARMDADDISEPARLQRQVEFLKGHPDVGLLSCAFEMISEGGGLLRRVDLPLTDSDIRFHMRRWNAFCHPAVMMKTDAFFSTSGYRKALLDADDYDLWLRMAEHTNLANIDEVLLRYRVHPGQASIANMEHQTLCVLAARAASAEREGGRPDPLSGVTNITVEVVSGLGVTEAEKEDALICAHRYWIETLVADESGAIIGIMENLTRLYASGRQQRWQLSDAWLDVATMQYRQKRPLRALCSAARGISVRPIVAVRPIKKAIEGLLRLSRFQL